ncbi:ATP-binding protein [Trichothermofontia sichuanensis B231]|uniref:ATP-binding protein n=1 Tax=Trichothermofontia sichuanensis TaxID=3045816 RepID=UPI0022463B6F|nr:anti-sigma regulatory factor [Trichothermofontia sichuanensis]UZQ52900.1 ATP-binding protein [Trichothermofontia sichuanensis B231]
MKSELHVPSDLKFLEIVEHWLLGCLAMEFGDNVEWPHKSSRLRLALVEAYANVVRHAHKDQPQLPILFRLEVRDREIDLEVWDYGKGYDLGTYQPPQPEECQEGGYGWLIMTRLMDRVEYCLQIDGRNCLKLMTTVPEMSASVEDKQTVG